MNLTRFAARLALAAVVTIAGPIAFASAPRGAAADDPPEGEAAKDGGAHDRNAAEPRVEAELRDEVRRLRALVAKLEAQVEPADPPINLARTDLAAAEASSVNGGRGLADPFYGVGNLFDDGLHWLNGINYTSWLSSGEAQPWVEVHFRSPVTVTKVVAEGGVEFTARLVTARGAGDVAPSANGVVTLPRPAAGVTAVRLGFRTGPPPQARMVEVKEVHVLGRAPPGVAYRVGPPAVAVNDRTVSAMAAEAFARWRDGLFADVRPEVKAEADRFVVTYARGDLPLLRVTLDRKTGKVGQEDLARLAPAEPPREGGAKGR